MSGQIRVKRWQHQPDRARLQKQAKGCSLAMSRVLAGMDHSTQHSLLKIVMTMI